MRELAHDIFDLIGNTPLLKIPQKKFPNVEIYAKLEYHNLSGSVKDRAVKNIIIHALKENFLTGKTLIDATSGNTGIAYATFGSALKIPIELALPENASTERKLILQSLGAKIHFTSPLEGTDGSQRFVKNLVNQFPDRYFYPNQYNNHHNWRAHFETTGPEIWNQTKGKVTHFLCGLGTTGTFIGASRFLKTKGVHCIAIHPDNPMHGLEGWKHLETAIVPEIYDDSVAHENREVDTINAYRYAISAAHHLGLFLSPSASANLCAAMEYSAILKRGVIVTIFPDNAFKYLHESFWSNRDYHTENLFI